MRVIKPDFYIWLGDNPGHDIWEQDPAHLLDSTRRISWALSNGSYGSKGAVYPVLGNHEGLPCDTFNLETKTHDWILKETAECWAPWLTSEGRLRKHG